MNTLELLDAKTSGRTPSVVFDTFEETRGRRRRRNTVSGAKVMRKLGLRPKSAEYVFDSSLVPKHKIPKGYHYEAVAIKELRPKNRFYFELDAPAKDNGLEIAKYKAETLQRLLTELPKDFKEYEIEETTHGYHIVARIKPKQWRHYFEKYKAMFDGDFVDTGDRLGLRISPKIGLKNGEQLSPSPKVVISTFKTKRPEEAPSGTEVYLTNV